MKETPLVSILLPVYNVELYLAECLDSVLNQSYRNFELIAVNDGATDGSKQILLDYEERFTGRLVIVDQVNQGLSAARNTGLNIAKGEFVYFLDSDDWILSDTLEKCVATLEKDNADLVIFNAKAFCDGMPSDIMKNLDYTRNLPADIYTDGHLLFCDSRQKGSYIVQSCCYMYRVNRHPDLRFIPGILHEDNYFTTMLFLCSSRISVLPDRFFQRRIRQGSITTSSASIRHALGYYETVICLHNELPKKSESALEVSRYFNYMVLEGVRIETEVNNGKMTMLRKLELLSRLSKAISYKTLVKILLPNTSKKLLAVAKR